MRKVKFVFFILISVFICSVNVQASTVFKSNNTSKIGDYVYELWKDTGNTTMTIEDDGEFSCEWNNINEVMFTKGKKFDIKNSYKEINSLTVDFDCDFESEGCTYIGVYGGKTIQNIWVEYHIIEDIEDFKTLQSWRCDQFMGTITVDGATYDVYKYENKMLSCFGNDTYHFYYIVRTSGRKSGTVNVLEYFKALESLGIDLGNMDNAAFIVGALRSEGEAKVNSVSIDIEYNNYILGDINGDENTDSMDFALLRSYLLGYRDLSEYEYGLEAADVNRDEEVNSLDFALYKNYLLGKIKGFY